MDQITFSEAEYQTKKRRTRREIKSMRRFASLKLARLPDETAILNFQHVGMKMHIGVNDALLAKISGYSDLP